MQLISVIKIIGKKVGVKFNAMNGIIVQCFKF